MNVSNVDNRIRGDNPLKSCKVSNSYDNPPKKRLILVHIN